MINCSFFRPNSCCFNMLHFSIDRHVIFVFNKCVLFVVIHQVISQVAVFRNFFVVTKYKRAQKFETECDTQQQIQTAAYSQ